MIKLIAIAAFALAIVTSALAFTPAPLHQENVITQARFGCGPGRTRVGGVCVARHHHPPYAPLCAQALVTPRLTDALTPGPSSSLWPLAKGQAHQVGPAAPAPRSAGAFHTQSNETKRHRLDENVVERQRRFNPNQAFFNVALALTRSVVSKPSLKD